MRRARRLLAVLSACAAIGGAQMAHPGKNKLTIRGRQQDVYFLRARNLQKGAPNTAIVFASGADGWRGFAFEIADSMASWGHDVYGLDARRYFASFTGNGTEPSINEMIGDMGSVGTWALQGLRRRLIFAGWSEGAGLGVLALTTPENRKIYRGLAAIALEKRIKTFPTGPFLPLIPPAAVLMVQSVRDGRVSLDTSKLIFEDAREPKRLSLIDAWDHEFQGNRTDLLQALQEGIHWIVRETPQ